MKKLTLLLIPVILIGITGCAQNKKPSNNDIGSSSSAMRRYNDSVLLVNRGVIRTDSLRIINVETGQDADYKFNKYHFGIENKTNKTWWYKKILCHLYRQGKLLWTGEAREDNEHQYGYDDDYRKVEPNTVRGFTLMTNLAGNDVDCRVEIIYDNRQSNGSISKGDPATLFANSESLPFNGNFQHLNPDDTNSCINVLCSGEWVFDKNYCNDQQVEPTAKLKDVNHGALSNDNYRLILTQSTWVFHKNGTYKIIGKSTKMQGVDPAKFIKKDTAIYGTWSFNTVGADNFAPVYNVKSRQFNFSMDALNITAPELVSVAGQTLGYWEGSELESVEMKAPFLYNVGNNFVWIHKPLGKTEAATSMSDTLILIAGARSEDGGSITFKTNNKQELLCAPIDSCIANNIRKYIWNDDLSQINTAFLNKKYYVVYTIKPIYNESAGNSIDEGIISKMVMVK